MAVVWWIVSAVTSALILIYLAFFWKINWIKDLTENDAKRSWLNKRLGDGKSGGGSRNKNRKVGHLPPVYPNGWFALLESSHLKRGEAKHISALGQNFAVFRTQKGTVSVLDAYCPHLGANMGEGGRVRGDCLECPFHGWLFRGADGRCQDIPYSDKVPEFAKTKAWDCCEVNQLIFVWHHAENAKPSWRPQALGEISDGRWRYHGRNEFIVNSHIQEIPENGADWAHLSAVHGPSILLSERVPWLARHSWTGAEWTSHVSPPQERTMAKEEEAGKAQAEEECGAEVDNAPETDPNISRENVAGTGKFENGGGKISKDKTASSNKSHKAIMRLRHSLILFERIPILELDVRAEQIGPGYVELLVQSSMGPMCILQTVTPLEPLMQRVTHLMFAPPLLAPLATLVLFGESVMFERDVAVWNHKRFEQRPLLVREDRSILAYRRWYAQFYSPHSPTYQSTTRSLQW
ncbi:cholesterol 7-desaturase nvd [Neodiprion fabricii]|uniref:cholesterol 7-desaturase nvd n=1 Tax=Neodiprion fabricii TaxID=2872261 RepID=UPI001ED96CE7|nr:cholesterol 7-desaturase nvd [Neodiprion fabricii]XP_046430331.1 cholesterol 7-desaturase nvd [Neodiprion fabricii]